MAELSALLSRKGWWVRSAFVSFLAVTLTAAIISGALFLHHDRRLLWLLFAPVGFAGYLIYLGWKRPSPAAAEQWTPSALQAREPFDSGPKRQPLPRAQAAASPQLPRSLYLSFPSLSLRLLAAAVVAGAASFAVGAAIVLLLLAGAAAVALFLAKKRVDLDELGATVVPLLPFLPERRLLWSSLGPFREKRELGLATVNAPLNYQPPDSRAASIGVGLGALYGPGWLEMPLPASEFAELLESYRSAGPPIPAAPALPPPPPPGLAEAAAVAATAIEPAPPEPAAATITIQFHWVNGRVADAKQNVPLSMLGLGERPAPGTVVRYSGKRWRVDGSAPIAPPHAGRPAPEVYPLFELPD